MLELNPALIKAIEHLNSGYRILHSLRLEKAAPGVAGDGFDSDWVAQDSGKGSGDFIRSDAMSGFQLDNTASMPILLDEFRGYMTDVRCGDHRNRFVEWLEEARNDTAVG